MTELERKAIENAIDLCKTVQREYRLMARMHSDHPHFQEHMEQRSIGAGSCIATLEEAIVSKPCNPSVACGLKPEAFSKVSP